MQLPADVTQAVPNSEGHDYQGVIERGAWVDAQHLQAGYRLLNADASWAEVVSVSISHEPLVAYNLTVRDYHTYFVAGSGVDETEAVWVHNDCWDELPNGSQLTGRTTSTDKIAIYETSDGKAIYQGDDGRWYKQYNDKIQKSKNVKHDEHAEILARRFDGEAQMEFSQDPAAREFDFISDEYVGQAKPGGFRSGSSFKNQAKETFQAAHDTGRTAYFHFNGEPHRDTVNVINRYARERGLPFIIDTTSIEDLK